MNAPGGACQFRVERLADRHNRSRFDSGVPALDTYFHSRVGQDVRRRMAACFVALDEADGIAGFYTMSATGIALAGLPEDVVRRLPRYPSIPCYLIGRLAVGRKARGQKLGAALLADALRRALRADAAAFALLVEAKDEEAGGFYRHHGFMPLVDRPLTLFLPLATAARLLDETP